MNIIKKSYQNLLLELENGGTGKTTLMKSLEKEFDKDKENIISVWFDAWKYENEKEFALIPLLKTINYSIKEDISVSYSKGKIT